MSLTLQFVRPLHRDRVMGTIYNGMNHQACLILIEKVLAEETLMNRLFIKYYYDLKRRNGYSDTEIAQKREALENVLIPYRLEENRQLLASAGFRFPEVFFKWYYFCGILALKCVAPAGSWCGRASVPPCSRWANLSFGFATISPRPASASSWRPRCRSICSAAKR